MKTMKKLMALTFAIVMMLALAVTANAAEITVTNVREGETYTYYKLMNYEVEASGAYRYTIPQTKTALKEILEDCGMEFAADTANNVFVLTNSSDFTSTDAQAIIDSLNEYSATDLAAAALDKDSKVATSNEEAVFSGLDTGLYFVTTTTGSLCSLASYNAQELVVDKHEPSTVVKEAAETNTGVGETVHYTATIDAKKGETITFTDTLSTGLTLDAQSATNPTISVDTGTVETWNTDPGDGNTNSIKITFPEMTADTTITIEYTATVNTDAITMDQVQNKANISYGNAQSKDAIVTTPLYDFTLHKIDGTTKGDLSGVKFTVKNTTSGSAGYGKYYDGTTIWSDSADELTTESDGTISVTGIPAGTYEVTETKTIDTYNKLSDPITVTVTADGTVTVSDNASASADGTVTIENFSGVELPSTGGMGTKVIYGVGAVLVLGAAVILVSRKRAGE